ncbi:hypothetical protein GCM10009646_01170 [Streptomyces aureus]
MLIARQMYGRARFALLRHRILVGFGGFAFGFALRRFPAAEPAGGPRAARSSSTPDSSTGHQGFRCAVDAGHHSLRPAGHSVGLPRSQ